MNDSETLRNTADVLDMFSSGASATTAAIYKQRAIDLRRIADELAQLQAENALLRANMRALQNIDAEVLGQVKARAARYRDALKDVLRIWDGESYFLPSKRSAMIEAARKLIEEDHAQD